jgi:hypothetical protein
MCPFLFHFLVATAAIMVAHNLIVALFVIQLLFVVPKPDRLFALDFEN